MLHLSGESEQRLKAVRSQLTSRIQHLTTELAEAKNKVIQSATDLEVLDKLKRENAALQEKVRAKVSPIGEMQVLHENIRT